jgi:hypothetical protein
LFGKNLEHSGVSAAFGNNKIPGRQSTRVPPLKTCIIQGAPPRPADLRRCTNAQIKKRQRSKTTTVRSQLIKTPPERNRRPPKSPPSQYDIIYSGGRTSLENVSREGWSRPVESEELELTARGEKKKKGNNCHPAAAPGLFAWHLTPDRI